MNWFWKQKKVWRGNGDALGLNWAEMKVDSAGQEYFDLGDVHLYPWTWNPVMDVIDAKTGAIVEENVGHTHPVYGRALFDKYLLPGRHNNHFRNEAPQMPVSASAGRQADATAEVPTSVSASPYAASERPQEGE